MLTRPISFVGNDTFRSMASHTIEVYPKSSALTNKAASIVGIGVSEFTKDRY